MSNHREINVQEVEESEGKDVCTAKTPDETRIKHLPSKGASKEDRGGVEKRSSPPSGWWAVLIS